MNKILGMSVSISTSRFAPKNAPTAIFLSFPMKKGSKPLLSRPAQRMGISSSPAGREEGSIDLFWRGNSHQAQTHDYALLLKTIYSSCEIAPDCEITLEANPEDIDLPLMRKFHLLGINRVSIGVQSLNDTDLILLGRTHSAGKALKAIQETHDAGITNISIDLMFELPRQTLHSWEKSLKALSSICRSPIFPCTT